jgi:hypothetical protein
MRVLHGKLGEDDAATRFIELRNMTQLVTAAHRFRKPSDNCLIGDVWCVPDNPNRPNCPRQNYIIPHIQVSIGMWGE